MLFFFGLWDTIKLCTVSVDYAKRVWHVITASILMYRKVFKCLHVYTECMREIKAIAGGKVTIKDNVEEIYEKRITPYGNGAKIDASKRHIGKKVFVIVLKD